MTAATPDCPRGADADVCAAAQGVGASIGFALIVAVWCVVDFLLAVGYAIYRLAKRP